MLLEKRFVTRTAEALDLLGITQAELARRMHVSRAMVNQYMNGSRSPGLDVVERFALALEVDPLDLLAKEKLSSIA